MSTPDSPAEVLLPALFAMAMMYGVLFVAWRVVKVLCAAARRLLLAAAYILRRCRVQLLLKALAGAAFVFCMTLVGAAVEAAFAFCVLYSIAEIVAGGDNAETAPSSLSSAAEGPAAATADLQERMRSIEQLVKRCAAVLVAFVCFVRWDVSRKVEAVLDELDEDDDDNEDKLPLPLDNDEDDDDDEFEDDGDDDDEEDELPLPLDDDDGEDEEEDAPPGPRGTDRGRRHMAILH